MRERERGFLNAEGAKVTQRAQRKTEKEYKMKTKKDFLIDSSCVKNRSIFLVFILYFLFCAICETFAPSAFKKCISLVLKNGLLSKVSPILPGN